LARGCVSGNVAGIIDRKRETGRAAKRNDRMYVGQLAIAPEKGVNIGGRAGRKADYLSAIVDSLRTASSPSGKGPKVGQESGAEQKGVCGAGWRGSPSGDLAMFIDRKGGNEIAAERPQIGDRIGFLSLNQPRQAQACRNARQLQKGWNSHIDPHLR